MGSEPQSIFFAKSLAFLSSVIPCIVSMNNEFSPVVLWLELSQCCKDIIMMVIGVKGVPLRKYQDQGKFQWIPCNGNDGFPVLGHMPRPFRRCFSRSKPDLLMVSCEVVDGFGRESLHREKQAD
jgi:hypothetical protein